MRTPNQSVHWKKKKGGERKSENGEERRRERRERKGRRTNPLTPIRGRDEKNKSRENTIFCCYCCLLWKEKGKEKRVRKGKGEGRIKQEGEERGKEGREET